MVLVRSLRHDVDEDSVHLVSGIVQSGVSGADPIYG